MRIIDYINQGGAIMYILLALNIIGFAIMLSKFFILSKESKATETTADELAKKVLSDMNGKDSNSIIEIAKQELSTYISNMERGINTVKIIASISPLLGLLGTVLGVLIAFRVMSQTGLNNPSSFAEGISLALITTVGGMIVAIPHYIGHNYLLSMIDHLETNLEQKIIKKVL
ncbi:transporter, MotA/TolQ/ExbB proton channel family protein [Bacteriovorax sp. BSW11_IV]|uniref:MotA/TolQ/ExbB proton channel family protein n=1 Tax=Bacteriovorax sp. BSW11_IV TaxID=1353529 RepID=UPI00038A334A|nr:MotA/TolQ/ExbB proton channel family protein [Bacteriovorax sp. BSW11_IV]EQC49248.1 transporter, MotA/TolQ/ExbB proton channel family protein [Bacteriovorax sp. BSW11_IV]